MWNLPSRHVQRTCSRSPPRNANHYRPCELCAVQPGYTWRNQLDITSRRRRNRWRHSSLCPPRRQTSKEIGMIFNFKFFVFVFAWVHSHLSSPSQSLIQICNYCKSVGANVGCCFDIGNDSVQKFCRKKYHVDCGYEAGATFNVGQDRGTVSICFEHRDPLER